MEKHSSNGIETSEQGSINGLAGVERENKEVTYLSMSSET